MLILLACAVEDSGAPKGTDTGSPVDTVDTVDTVETADTVDSQVDTAFAWDVCDWPNAPYDNVADAAAAAEDGATLTICAGTFEGATLTDRTLSLVGQGPDQTIITGDGFTALTVDGGALSIAQLALTGVSNGEKGAALAATDVVVDATDITISGLSQSRIITQSGGATTWTRLRMEGNSYPVDSTDQSSLIRVEGDGTIDLIQAELRGNQAWLGVYVYGGALGLYNSLVVDNLVGPPGLIVAGGDGDETHVLHNNVIIDNQLDADPYAAVIQLFFADLRNTLMVGNTGGAYLVYGGATVEYNLVWENDAGDELVGTGNLAADPLLDADNQPGAGSPAIDAGDPDPAYLDADGTRADLGIYGGPLAWPAP